MEYIDEELISYFDRHIGKSLKGRNYGVIIKKCGNKTNYGRKKRDCISLRRVFKQTKDDSEKASQLRRRFLLTISVLNNKLLYVNVYCRRQKEEERD